jgi:hypothetical protein
MAIKIAEMRLVGKSLLAQSRYPLATCPHPIFAETYRLTVFSPNSANDRRCNAFSCAKDDGVPVAWVSDGRAPLHILSKQSASICWPTAKSICGLKFFVPFLWQNSSSAYFAYSVV